MNVRTFSETLLTGKRDEVANASVKSNKVIPARKIMRKSSESTRVKKQTEKLFIVFTVAKKREGETNIG